MPARSDWHGMLLVRLYAIAKNYLSLLDNQRITPIGYYYSASDTEKFSQSHGNQPQHEDSTLPTFLLHGLSHPSSYVSHELTLDDFRCLSQGCQPVLSLDSIGMPQLDAAADVAESCVRMHVLLLFKELRISFKPCVFSSILSPQGKQSTLLPNHQITKVTFIFTFSLQ